MAEVAISLPFRLDPFGKIVTANTQEKIWGDRVRGVVGTTFRERVMRPNYGTELVEKLFTNLEETKLQIDAAVEDAFDNFLPDLTLVNVDVVEALESGTVNVDITYQLPNKKNTTVSIGYVQIQGANPLFEQLLNYQERLNDQ